MLKGYRNVVNRYSNMVFQLHIIAKMFSEVLLGTIPGSSLGAPWGLLEAPWELLGVSVGNMHIGWEILEAPWKLLGAPREVLGSPWGLLGAP